MSGSAPVTQEPEASTKATDIKARGAGIVDVRLEVVVIPVSTPAPRQREPELAGQTIVAIGGSAGIGLKSAAACGGCYRAARLRVR